jgi:hypothetical protein
MCGQEKSFCIFIKKNKVREFIAINNQANFFKTTKLTSVLMAFFLCINFVILIVANVYGKSKKLV